MRRTVAALLATAGLGVALNLAPGSTPSATAAPGGHLWVSPLGDDQRSGASPTDPLRTVQHALELAQPGDTVHLGPGRYVQDVATVRDGAPGAPITVTGPADAVLAGAGAARIVQVFHDHHVLSGFTIDGAVGDGTFRDKLVYALGRDAREGVTGLRLTGMTLQNAGGECVRLRYFSHHNEIGHNTIRNCGQDDFPGGTWAGGGKNGEGVYIGTAVDQWADGKGPTADPDASDANWVHDNAFDTRGNECVDIKEGASGNVVERNDCTGQRDPESAGFDSRGDANVFRSNVSHDNLGAGIRLGGHTVGGRVYGVGNDVIGNRFVGNARGPLRATVEPQGRVCGNTATGSGDGLATAQADTCPPDVALPADQYGAAGPVAGTGVETGTDGQTGAADGGATQTVPPTSEHDTSVGTAHPGPEGTAAPPTTTAAPVSAASGRWHDVTAVAASGVRAAARWASTNANAGSRVLP